MEETTVTSSPTPSTSPPTTAKRRQLPGPISPQTPVGGKIKTWHAWLADGSTSACTELFEATHDRNREHQLDGAIVDAYLGAAHACLGDLVAAREHLELSADALRTLPENLRAKVELRCGVEELVEWAWFTYLDEERELRCPPMPASTSETSETSESSATSATGETASVSSTATTDG